MTTKKEILGSMYDTSRKIVYQQLTLTPTMEKKVQQTPWRKQSSRNSYCFTSSDNAIKQVLEEVFEINSPLFDEKFEQAISGDGNEKYRIARLHSSSLLCLLHFYGVSKEKPLKLLLGSKVCTFTKSKFEVKTFVGLDAGNKEHYSNMDVVLEGTDVHGHRVILFLESKFSEYLSGGEIQDISPIYNEIYEKIAPIGGEIEFKTNTLKSINRKRTGHYCAGLKQMVSHYMGITNAINGQYGSKSDTDYKELSDATIYLAEIVFPLEHPKLEDYRMLHADLSQKLNKKAIEDIFQTKAEHSAPSFYIVDTLLEYPDVFNYGNNNQLVEGIVDTFYYSVMK